jgi:Putative porin
MASQKSIYSVEHTMPFATSSKSSLHAVKRCAPQRLSRLSVALVGCIALGSLHTAAQADEKAELEQLRNTTLALIQALVDQGLLNADKAQALIRQASAPRAATAAASASAPAGTWGAPLGAATGTVRVPYIPESMKAQIKEDIKSEVLATARDEGWADARKIPTWLRTFNFAGDVRVRAESARFGEGNTPASVYRSQLESPAWSPDLLNTEIGRNRLTLRARFGFDAKVSDDMTAELRLSTGSSPTSASQTLGSSPGFFNRYTIALDRAWLKYEPMQDLKLQAGRMPVPFMGTDLLWPDDLAVDGVAVRAERNLASGVFAFANVGAFALQELELTSSDKWLLGAQVGVDWALDGRTSLRLGAAVYDFKSVEGTRETGPAPTGPLAGTVPYYSGEYRSGARLRGNTLISLNDPTNTGAPVWGLASKFRPVNLTAALSLDQFDPVNVGVTLDYVKNSAFDIADIQRRANSAAVADLANKTTGLQARFTVGSKSMSEKGSWNSFFAMRRFDRDAWVDALTDTTWNLGGTNYKGYSLGGAYAFDRRSTVGLRWTSTRNLDDGRRFLSNPNDPASLSGNLSSAPLKIDVIQLEVNARF